MSRPQFLLTGKVPLTLYRKSPGRYVQGRWVEGEEVEIVIEANVQPMRDWELVQLPEADRTRDYQKIYSVSQMRALNEAADGWQADEFLWDAAGDGVFHRYEIMKVRRYKMGVLDHYRAFAARKELTPN